MELGKARDYFRIGVIKKISIVPAPMEANRWLIVVLGPDGPRTLHRQSGGEALYRLEAAASAVCSITGRPPMSLEVVP